MNETLLRATFPPDWPVRILPVTDSTNRVAKEWAREGAPHGACVIARRQTAGRGRLGRTFFSPEGGLYMSVILKTDADAGLLTTLAAVAVRRAVMTVLGVPLDIKWVNDLLLDGRKVCGILAEGVISQGQRVAAVVGIGVNVATDELPQDIRSKAGALLHEPPAEVVLERLAGMILAQMLDGLPKVPHHLAEYRAHCVTIGKAVRYTGGAGGGTGVAVDISQTGALLVKTSDGTIALETGEAQVRLEDGSYQ